MMIDGYSLHGTRHTLKAQSINLSCTLEKYSLIQYRAEFPIEFPLSVSNCKEIL